FSDTASGRGQKYAYWVTAVDLAGTESKPSAEGEVQTQYGSHPLGRGAEGLVVAVPRGQNVLSRSRSDRAGPGCTGVWRRRQGISLGKYGTCDILPSPRSGPSAAPRMTPATDFFSRLLEMI